MICASEKPTPLFIEDKRDQTPLYIHLKKISELPYRQLIPTLYTRWKLLLLKTGL